VLHTPGHTPADISYKIEDAVFVGDTLFMPDYGTARADFPGGDAHQLYCSIKRLLALTAATRLFICHDYKAPGRDAYAWETTVQEQRDKNVHVGGDKTEAEFVATRTSRDATLSAPTLLLPSIQVNIRAGTFPPAEDNGVRYLRIPVTFRADRKAARLIPNRSAQGRILNALHCTFEGPCEFRYDSSNPRNGDLAMTYTLAQFSADCRAALLKDPGPAGRELVRQYTEKACTEAEFVAKYLGPDADAERRILYEDPDLHFCILAHVYRGAKNSSPHDHGPSWAVYSQVTGVTEMTDWKLVEKPANGQPGKVVKGRTYDLKPGKAHVYNEGDVHSPRRESETRLIRIEGTDLTKVKRDKFEIAA
jgi:hypothetical protein